LKYQLREYVIEEGKLDDFVREWREHILPLRLALDFGVLGPWVDREASRFVWMIGYDGDFEEANARYYASPVRAAMDPDPARLIVEQRLVLLDPV
jgi:hypothetical protein